MRFSIVVEPKWSTRDRPDLTYGFEQEIQLVDDKGNLVKKATEFLNVIRNEASDLTQPVTSSSLVIRDKKDGIRRIYFDNERLQSIIEIATLYGDSLGEVFRGYLECKKTVIRAARSLGYRILLTGFNPVTQHIIPGETFSENHHIGARSFRDRIRIYRLLRNVLPELWAVSVNSPFYRSQPTRYKSFRGERTGHYTVAIGLPPMVPSDLTEYNSDVERKRLYENLVRAQRLSVNENPRYTDVTIFSNWKTVEVRLFDTQTAPAHTLMLGAICYALAKLALRFDDLEDISRFILETNRARAIEKGMEAVFWSQGMDRKEFLYHKLGKGFQESAASSSWRSILELISDELEPLRLPDSCRRILDVMVEKKLTLSDWQLQQFAQSSNMDSFLESLFQWSESVDVNSSPLLV